VDHTQYDTTSILKFIETRWGLEPLGTRDAGADGLTNAFDFSQAPPGMPTTGQAGDDLLLLVLAGLGGSLLLAGAALRRRRA
jgi:hypothetical protein